MPTSTNSFATVFLATPVMRTVERIELPLPGTGFARARRVAFNLFILTIIP